MTADQDEWREITKAVAVSSAFLLVSGAYALSAGALSPMLYGLVAVVLAPTLVVAVFRWMVFILHE